MGFRRESEKGPAVKSLPTIEKIKAVAEEREISRYRISQGTGISQSILSKMWHGRGGCSLTHLQEIMDYLELEIREKK